MHHHDFVKVILLVVPRETRTRADKPFRSWQFLQIIEIVENPHISNMLSSLTSTLADFLSISLLKTQHLSEWHLLQLRWRLGYAWAWISEAVIKDLAGQICFV